MPKPVKFTYEKKRPFRDASFFIIVCEGENREPDYFRFFDGLSSRVKVVPVRSNSGSSPRHLIENAIEKEGELECKPEIDRVWFVVDTDRWGKLLHELRQECDQHINWKVAQSNPCFEVWLYFHVADKLPDSGIINQCKDWKNLLPKTIKGGFNSDYHPVALDIAVINSKICYREDGYSPLVGSTQLWQLGEELLPLIVKDLENLKVTFPRPVMIG
ncbi:MAG: RloB domain-containing protein [Bacteroidota bacterium]|nr:RloB domain-containing protein [Bacteroidota bacterium]